MTCLLFSCSNQQELAPNDWFVYINDPENGLIKEREVNGIQYQLKYLPPDYWIYREHKRRSQLIPKVEQDSIRNLYTKSAHFLLTLSTNPEKLSDVDITKVGVSNYQMYTQRMLKMNFHMKEQFSLKGKKYEQEPTFVNLENVHGLSTKRNFNIVFERTNDLKDAPKWDLRIEDDTFYTGIHHFSFRKKDIQSIPTIKL